MANAYEVVVGNVGTVLTTDVFMDALKTYTDYLKLSKDHVGRASGEEVVLFKNGEPLYEHPAENQEG